MNAQARTVERLVHINPPGANDSRYFYIPFEVPPRAARISVSYQYDRAGGANTIDIGLFDARSTGSDTDPQGFRGWSGGRRSEFSVSRDEATPGYLPGELPAGTWRVILGLYKVVPAGVDVSLRIEIEVGEHSSPGLSLGSRKAEVSPAVALSAPLAEGSARRSTPPSPEAAGRSLRWWKGDLHMHTVHSDGDWTVAELISGAGSAGLDFICITDHNTASHHAEIDRPRGGTPPLVLRGEEVTTYGGHTNALGLPSGAWIDFRSRPGDGARMSDIAAQAHRSGALVSINHPFALCGGCAWSYDSAVPDFDGIEVWNGAWDPIDEQALTMWDGILRGGRHVTAIASTDTHRQDTPLGRPTTHVAAKALSRTDLLDAIRRGRVYLTSEVARPVVRFEAEAATGERRARRIIGDVIRLRAPGAVRFFIAAEAAPPGATVSLISNGQVMRTFPAQADGRPQMIEIECPRDSYFRLEVRDKTKAMVALTNPIYVKVGKGR